MELLQLRRVGREHLLAVVAVLVGLELAHVEPISFAIAVDVGVIHLAGLVRLLPPRVLELLELALLAGGAPSEVRVRDLRVHDHVLEHDANLAVVLLHELFEGRTDPLAVGSSKVPGFDNCDGGSRRGTFDEPALDARGDVDREDRVRIRLLALLLPAAAASAGRRPSAGSRAPRRTSRSAPRASSRELRGCRRRRPLSSFESFWQPASERRQREQQ